MKKNDSKYNLKIFDLINRALRNLLQRDIPASVAGHVVIKAMLMYCYDRNSAFTIINSYLELFKENNYADEDLNSGLEIINKQTNWVIEYDKDILKLGREVDTYLISNTKTAEELERYSRSLGKLYAGGVDCPNCKYNYKPEEQQPVKPLSIVIDCPECEYSFFIDEVF